MALLDKNGRNVLYGVGLGLGFAFVLPALRLIFNDAGRPLAKASIKSGLLAYEKGREVLAEWSETFEDLVAEVQADLHGGTETVTAASAAGAWSSKMNGEV